MVPMAIPFLKMHIFKRKFPFKSVKTFQKVTFQIFFSKPSFFQKDFKQKKYFGIFFHKSMETFFF